MLRFISVSIRDSKFLDLLQEKKRFMDTPEEDFLVMIDQKESNDNNKTVTFVPDFFDSYYLISLVVTV